MSPMFILIVDLSTLKFILPFILFIFILNPWQV